MSAATVTPAPGLRALLRAPGVPWLLAAAMVGRLPAATLGLLFVLRTRELTGSLGLAGAVTGVYAVCTGASMPALGRLVDRRGQRPVLIAGAIVASCGIAALAVLPHGVSAAALVGCAVVAGAGLPPIGSCVRVLLPVVLPDADRRHAAFSLDSALVEVGYVAGPALVAGALGAWSTAAACGACILLLATGVGAFVAHPAAATGRTDDSDGSESTRGPAESLAAATDPSAPRSSGLLGPLRGRGVRVLVGVLALVGGGFGAVEVGIPAVTAAAGSPHAAGPLLALWGLGSMTGGFVAAHRSAPRDGAGRARVLLVVLALADAPLALAAHPLALALLLPLAGIAIAPMFACVFGLLDRLSPAGTVTEAYGWMTSGITAGLACGAAVAGQLAERVSPGAALGVAALASACAALLAWARRDAFA